MLPLDSRPLLRSAAAVAAVLALAGCAGQGTAAAPASAPASSSTVTVDNCGTIVELDAPPQRVITIKSTSTEMLLALGLGDRIVGTAFQDGPLPADLQQAGAGLPSLSDKVPSEEAVLQQEPDLVYGGWESNFSADGAGERGELQSLGVATYVSPSACKEPGYQPDPLTWDEVFREVGEAGSLFGAQDAASALIAEQRAMVSGVTPDSRGLSALWYSSGSDTPYVGAGIGAPQMMLDTIGLTNIAADVHDTWTPLGWEAVVDADPDVIVLVDATWNTAQSKMDRLASDPATADLTAVKNKRYLVIPFPAGEAGVRNAPATVDLAAQLADLQF